MFNAKEMSDYAFSLAYNLFNDKKMWDYAYYYLFGLACYYWHDHWLPLLKEVPNMIRGVPTDIAKLKDELESNEDFINNADRKADAVEDKKKSLAIKAKIKQLAEVSFRIEDVIDEYMIHEEQQLAGTGFAAGGANFMKTCWYWICCFWCYWIPRLQIAYKIQNIKSRISGIKDHDFQIQSSSDTTSSSSATNRNTSLLQNLRDAPLYMDEADVVGFDEPRDKLIDWLIEGGAERTVVSIVGMGGLGKTTLAKKVFDNQKVVKHFNCHIWITVSRPYNIEKLLRDIMLEIYKQQGKDPPQSLHQMDRKSLINEVRNYLQGKRYVVVFDDVWDSHFWYDIEFAMFDNKNGCKILITTRNKDVPNACKTSSVEVHELKALTEEQSLKLFNKKAFRDRYGCCPENLIDISSKIVGKCKGLPLAIVVTGGLLSCKDRNPIEWYKFSENITAELKKYSMIRKIIGLSYHDLPYNLKSCFLYFGLYPEDYKVDSKTLTRQWTAEGFVKEERGRTLEEVAEAYLSELIHRSLVQVDGISINGRVESCRVHDLVHAMILEKHEDLSFCKSIAEDKQLPSTGMIRRLSIAPSSDNQMEGIESSHVRSLLILEPQTSRESFVRTIPAKYRRLKVLALTHTEVPNDLGSLNHLRYFEFCQNPKVYSELPKSIGMLVNLETLDLRETWFKNRNLPKEICKLRKLRHFLGSWMSLIHLKDGIGGMTSLQTLNSVYLDDKEDENDNRVVELIEELGKLDQLRELVLRGVRSKYMCAISSSVIKMQQLEKLHISGVELNTFIDLDLNSPPPKLQSVVLYGSLKKFPEWIPKLTNLVELIMVRLTKQQNGAMKLLQSMPNLLSLNIEGSDDYEHKLERLHFQDGWFNNLKELFIVGFNNLSDILIDEGALGSLKKLNLWFIPQLMMLPTGIQHLQKLEVLCLYRMSEELKQSIAPDDEGKEHWIFNQVPSVRIL